MAINVARLEVKFILSFVVAAIILGQKDNLRPQQKSVERELLSITILEGCNQFSAPFVVHDQWPLSSVSSFGCLKFDVQFHNFERLQTEHGLHLLLDYFFRFFLVSQRMFPSRIRL